MKDYIPIKKDTLLRFANHARWMGATEKELSTNEMLEISSQATADITEQAALIGQIKDALEGKVAGGAKVSFENGVLSIE